MGWHWPLALSHAAAGGAAVAAGALTSSVPVALGTLGALSLAAAVWGGGRRPSTLAELTEHLRRRASHEPLADPWSEASVAVGRSAERAELGLVLERLRRACQVQVQDLHLQKSRLEEILQTVEDGILVTGSDGRVVFGNSALVRLFGVRPPLEGRRPIEVMRHREVDDAMTQCHADGEPAVLELTHRGPPETCLEVHVGRLQRDDETFGTVTVFHDITRLRQLERVRRDFVANVSHELRTPLTAIKGYAETLADGALEDPTAAARFVQVIANHAERLHRLLDDILDLSRLEADGFAVQPVPCLVSELVEAAIPTVAPAVARKRLQLTVTVEAHLAVVCDPKLIGQALTNLLDNAAKYTPDEGAITVRAHTGAPPEGAGNVVVLEVSDTGIGIPSDDLQRIFERFYRVDKGRSRAMGGTGLGLSIVRHIVEAHGQRVWATSELGHGSVFCFSLPTS